VVPLCRWLIFARRRHVESCPSLGNVDQHRSTYGDQNFDPQANRIHQKPKDHIVRESAYYAFTLLLTG
jgi:hypothetical protein